MRRFSIMLAAMCLVGTGCLRLGTVEDKSRKETTTTGPAAVPETKQAGVGNAGVAAAAAEEKTLDRSVDVSRKVDPEVTQAGAINTSIQYVAAAGGIGAVLTLLVWQFFTTRATRLADNQETVRLYLVLKAWLSLLLRKNLSRADIAADRMVFRVKRRGVGVLQCVAVGASGACVGVVAFIGWQYLVVG